MFSIYTLQTPYFGRFGIQSAGDKGNNWKTWVI